jgi:hypothetical protein
MRSDKAVVSDTWLLRSLDAHEMVESRRASSIELSTECRIRKVAVDTCTTLRLASIGLLNRTVSRVRRRNLNLFFLRFQHGLLKIPGSVGQGGKLVR